MKTQKNTKSPSLKNVSEPHKKKAKNKLAKKKLSAGQARDPRDPRNPRDPRKARPARTARVARGARPARTPQSAALPQAAKALGQVARKDPYF